VMGIIQRMREVGEIAKKQGNTEIYAKILDLQAEVIEIVEEKSNLQSKVKELEDAIRIKGQMAFKEPFWYLEGDDTPHCSACFEKDNRAVHLVSLDQSPDGRFHCPVCKFLYFARSKSSESFPQVSSRGSVWG
jgi:hypothetical protein